jgi:hypothetical protein
MSTASAATMPPLRLPTRLRGWIAPWRRISQEQAIGAALLGIVAITPVVIQIANAPFSIPWLELIRICVNSEIWSFSLLLCVVLADERVDRGARALSAYGIAIVLAAVVGMLIGIAQSHFVWDAIVNPPAILKIKTEINPWVVYTHHVYIVIETVLIGSLATYLYVDRREARKMAQRLHEAGLRRADQAKSMLESQLQAMQARVEPQFLFNTLAQVKQLYDLDPLLGERMLDDLIAYLRAAMPKMRDTSSTLAQEIELARAYLEIVKLRTGSHLTFLIESSDAIGDARFPPMLLLPLIEHAIGQRFASGQGDEALRIRSEMRDGRLRVAVCDGRTGCAADAVRDRTVSIRERLTALYGDTARFELRHIDTGITEAIVEIPYERIEATAEA